MTRADAHHDAVWSRIDQPWDMVVVGGGICGTAIFHEATRAGLRVLLVEQRDFAWGTSSRSSKLVHGGFRYLQHGQLRVVRAAVRERRRLMAEARGLITPLGFLFANYHGDGPTWLYQAGLTIYDAMAAQWDHQRYDPTRFGWLAPHVRQAGLVAGLRCLEATTDDARLVLRLLREGITQGGTALNYTHATELLRRDGAVVGVRIQDALTGRLADVHAWVVINATGAWADHLRGQLAAPPLLRPLRGSHLIFPAWRFPVAQAIAFRHPLDRRFVNVTPWESVTIVGTTDHEHDQVLDNEPMISPEEVAYLMAGVDAIFPTLGLTLDDIVATFSGVRPVVNTGTSDPSQESRDHLVLEEHGLVTVTGGKLTTFRLMAHEALAAARHYLPTIQAFNPSHPTFQYAPLGLDAPLSEEARMRLSGRYGADAPALIAQAAPGELQSIAGTAYVWAELRWAVRHEYVAHLDDLLLRRVRLGLLLPRGGAELFPYVRAICQQELGWDDARWQAEEERYVALWHKHYSLPGPATIPDWRALLAEAYTRRDVTVASRQRQAHQRRRAVLLTSVTVGLGCLLLRHHRRKEAAP